MSPAGRDKQGMILFSFRRQLHAATSSENSGEILADELRQIKVGECACEGRGRDTSTNISSLTQSPCPPLPVSYTHLTLPTIYSV